MQKNKLILLKSFAFAASGKDLRPINNSETTY